MKIQYKDNEVISEEELCSSLDFYRNKLAKSKREKLLIKSEGKPDVVLVIRAEYEYIKIAGDEKESIEIAEIIKERCGDDKDNKMVSLEEINSMIDKKGN